MNVLESQQLSIGYTQKRIAQGLNLQIQTGELICLIGPNGAGKSTLLRTLAGMQAPLWGKICLGGEDLSKLKALERARRLSVVLTERISGDLLTGYELVALGRHPHSNWLGKITRQDQVIIDGAIRAVRAEHLAPRLWSELSDGERQKLMIARALAQEPQLMILDEPTAYLDLPRRVDMMRLLRDLAEHTQLSILLSTHDLDLALRTAHQIWLMSPDGTLETGAPEDLILSGAFERVFQGEGVQFDSYSGTFNIQKPQGVYIHLQGEGLTAQWTARALERAGYGLAHGHQPAAIVTITEASAWEFQQKHYSSIQALLSALKEKLHERH